MGDLCIESARTKDRCNYQGIFASDTPCERLLIIAELRRVLVYRSCEWRRSAAIEAFRLLGKELMKRL